MPGDLFGPIPRHPFQTRCEEYLLTSIAYYRFDVSLCADAIFDNICETLKLSYRKLPVWFTRRVSFADLSAGTGYMVIPTPAELERVNRLISGVDDLGLLTEEEWKRYAYR